VIVWAPKGGLLSTGQLAEAVMVAEGLNTADKVLTADSQLINLLCRRYGGQARRCRAAPWDAAVVIVLAPRDLVGRAEQEVALIGEPFGNCSGREQP
jgi:hypothetical protein